ncbi:AAA family ATPase [Gimesia chilikensis]|uniref:ATPase AAA-type core domain-containing protein n=1 Tax=Gimesia chilikensis TaxID=2605989 RepID=A0A517PY76_9PLAN|nr:AAA family ATPase [Gimesia chilikensis]QDT24340.1 hypothetical protein HG66A1_61720 [Gimesia chilikensis]
MNMTAIQPKQRADTLSATEPVIQEFGTKLQLIRDRVVSVANGYQTGVYIVGRPGTSKTFTVRQELELLDKPWVNKNARMTPMGLFEFLADHPEHVIVLDDITSLFKNEQALQILLAALDGQPDEPRLISYKSKDRDERIWFTGSIIAISNIPLRHDPLARALGSRIVMLEHEPTDEEVAVFIRHLALQGYPELSPDECLEVAEFLIAETRKMDQRLDLRHLTKAWQDYRQVKQGDALTSWQDLVRSSLQKQIAEPVRAISKDEDKEIQRQLIKELTERFPNDRHSQLAEWPHGKSTFYKRLKEVTSTARMV